LLSEANHYKPLAFTLIGIGMIVHIFYPLFLKLEDWVTLISVKLVKSGSSLAGKYFGIFFIFTSAMIVLLYFYLKMWYHIDIFRILVSGRMLEYF